MSDAPRPPSAEGAWPLVGHTPHLLREPLSTLSRWGRADDPVVTLRVAGRQFCLVTEPSTVATVFERDVDRFRKAAIVRERLGRLQGGSLVLRDGAEWADRRETLAAGFGAERTAAVGSLAESRAAERVAEWPENGPLRADEFSRDLSLSVLAQALFGLRLDGSDTPIHAAADDILARMDLRSVSTYLPDWVPTPTNRRFRHAVATLHARIDEIVAETDREGDTGDDLLSTMLAAGLPAETVRDELVAFLFAGFDSTATALSCTLGLLARTPSVQAALRERLDGALSGGGTLATAVSDVPLLDAVVRESLRLFPPQYLLFREPTGPVQLGGYRIAEGTTVLVSPWTLQRDPDRWPDPKRFRPHRWLDGDDTARPTTSPYAYLPFGRGPRHCIGARMATLILQVVVAVVCRRRTLALDGELSVTAGPTLSLEDGVSVRATRRPASRQT